MILTTQIIFNDSIGFLGLLCLIMQTAVAGILAAFCWVLSSTLGPWVRHLQVAFVALAAALIALAMRFIPVHLGLGDPSFLNEGGVFSAVTYGVYIAGKITFLWFLVSAIARLRDRAWPKFQTWPLAMVLAIAAVVSWSAAVEVTLLIQAPLVIAAFFGAARMLWPVRAGRGDVGHRAVAWILASWGLVWLGYVISILVIFNQEPGTTSIFDLVIKLNACFDLCFEVALGTGLIVIAMDGSAYHVALARRERDDLRDRMRQGEKLRSLSTLVSGVAHEINNPLTAIIGYADELDSEDEDVSREAVRIVREQAQRCRQIVRRLSILSPSRDVERAPVVAGELVARVVAGLELQFGSAGVSIELDQGAPGLRMEVEVASVEQVLTNLLVNALQVSSRGQRVWVRIGAQGGNVVIVVEDQGGGVPEMYRERVFEPFFSTKGEGGTGLGLALARVLVQSHGGTIVLGEGAMGARFTVSIPVLLEPGEVAVPAAPAAPEPVCELPRVEHGRRMLVVDDEETVRTTVARHAHAFGWQVVEAENGAEALDRLLKRGEHFDGVVCDLRMPGVSGIDLHDRLVNEAPQLLDKFVFITGDLTSTKAAEFARRSWAPIFTKPFSFAELLRAVRDRADGRGGRGSTPSSGAVLS